MGLLPSSMLVGWSTGSNRGGGVVVVVTCKATFSSLRWHWPLGKKSATDGTPTTP